MPKTDKELTCEIVESFLSAWSGEGKMPPKGNQLPDLIKTVYKAIHALAAEQD